MQWQITLTHCIFLSRISRQIIHCQDSCGASVPLVKQTWLCKKKGRYIALKIIAPGGEKRVRFEMVESAIEQGFGFNPSRGSRGGNATCPFCGTVADGNYVKAEGCAKRIGQQMMAQAFSEARRVIKSGAQMIVVYAHKTTLGWSTLVDALRQANFTVTEAWPLSTEQKQRLLAMNTAALALSIFLLHG